MKFSKRTSALALSCVAITGLLVGGAVVAVADEDDAPRQTSKTPHLNNVLMPNGQPANESTASWPTNEFGLTYGSVSAADVETRNLPVLIPFKAAPDSELGYLRSDQVYPVKPQSSEERIAQTKEKYNDQGEEVRTLYRPDGVTAIDEVVLSTLSLENAKGEKISPRTGEVLPSR